MASRSLRRRGDSQVSTAKAGIEAYLTEDEERMLESFRSDDFIPEDEIPSIIRRLQRLLNMRQTYWSSILPGPKVRSPNPTDTIKVMLVGVGGVGKSRLGTVLVGGANTAFTSSDTVESETRAVKRVDCDFCDQKVAVFDTPGYVVKDLLQNNISLAALGEVHNAIEKGLNEIGEGLHVIVFVISAGNSRMYDTEIKIMQQAMILNPETFQHCMMIVTHSKSKYEKHGRRKFLEDIKKTDRIIQLLKDINERVLLVELGSKLESYSSDTSLDTYAYDCEREQVRNMVFAMVAKVVEDNRRARRPILYLRKHMKADLDEARSRVLYPRPVETAERKKPSFQSLPIVLLGLAALTVLTVLTVRYHERS